MQLICTYAASKVTIMYLNYIFGIDEIFYLWILQAKW